MFKELFFSLIWNFTKIVKMVQMYRLETFLDLYISKITFKILIWKMGCMFCYRRILK